MVDWSSVAIFALTEALFSLSPGPAVFLVIALSMRHGLRVGWASICGIVATNALFFLLAALGVGAIILASHLLFTVLKWLGAAYLVWLGMGLIRAWWVGNGQGIKLGELESSSGTRGFWKAFGSGFTLQASNPKNIAFFVAILPQFVSPHGDIGLQMLVFGIVSIVIEVPILLLYAVSFSRLAKIMTSKLSAKLEAIAGGILVSLGVALAGSENR